MDMGKPAVSIIMPVYNSENYLPETIGSVLRQTMEDFELILVDDGSTDASGRCCDDAAAGDSRVRVIHKENGGICSARNTGLRAAEGEYIAFCDNDDEVSEKLVEDNYRLAKQYHADVVRFSRKYRAVREGKVLEESQTELRDGFIPAEEFDVHMEEIRTLGYGVWAGMYRRDFLEEHAIRFDENIRFGREDWDFTLRIWLRRPSVVINSQAYYTWIMRTEHSTSAKTDINNVAAKLHVLKEVRQLYEQTGYLERKPEQYLKDVADHIYLMADYVSPSRVAMPWQERIRFMKYFASDPVMQEKHPDKAVRALRKQYPRTWLLYRLFRMKQYRLLIEMVDIQRKLEHK